MSRNVVEQVKARSASDGAGVNLLRVFGGHGLERFDPFLMLDEFGSSDSADYIAGFPSHPHRGFETITYMLQGKMEHRDHMGNVGLISDGDVQWMTAGSGVIHSEMPMQTEGKMRGFQFWLNLPAAKKMTPARYQDVAAENIPEYPLGNGSFLKVIAGEGIVNDKAVEGFFRVPDTQAVIMEVYLESFADVSIELKDELNVLLYLSEGRVQLPSSDTEASANILSRFEGDGPLKIVNQSGSPARMIIMAGKPLKEPIVQHGPFVMNSIAEINQAIDDFQNGRLTDLSAPAQ